MIADATAWKTAIAQLSETDWARVEDPATDADSLSPDGTRR